MVYLFRYKFMIKKLRAYLLEDDDNRSSLSLYIIIILIAPFLGVFFQYKKEKSVSMATVNGYSLDRSIVKIKFHEETLLLQQYISVFGRQYLDHLLNILFQGRNPEEVVVQNEILKVYLQYLFEKNIGYYTMSEKFILSSLKNGDDWLISGIIGQFVFGLISGKMNKEDEGMRRNIDMNKLDHYCQYSVSGEFIKKVFELPLLSIYDVINDQCVMFPKKIVFDVYVCDLNKRKDIDSIKKGLSDSVLKNFYQNGIKDGLYNKDLCINGELSIYTLNRKELQDLKSDEEFNNLVQKKYDALLADSMNVDGSVDSEKIIKNNFINECFDKKGKFIIQRKDVLCDGFLLPQNVREFFAEALLKDNVQKVMTYVHQGKIYIFKHSSIPAREVMNFEEAKKFIIEDFLPVVIYEEIVKESDQLRYAYEETGKAVLPPEWKHEVMVYEKDIYQSLLSDKNSEKNQLEKDKIGSKGKDKSNGKEAVIKEFYDLVAKRIENLSLKKHITFINYVKDKSFTIYCVSEILEEEKNTIVERMHKNNVQNVQVFINAYLSAVLKKAKIDFVNNSDVSL